MQIRVGARQAKGGELIERCFGIADPFNLGQVVVVEIGLRPFRRAEMHKDRPHAFRFNLGTQLRNTVQCLRTEGTCKMAEKDEQNRRFIHQIEQRAAGLGVKLAQGIGKIQLLR